MNVYFIKSPIYMTEEEHQYDLGEINSYFLHQKSSYKARELERKINQAVEESDPELAPYIDEDNPIKGVVLSLRVGVKEGMAVAKVEATRLLTEEELEIVKDELLSQYSDGWGEGFQSEGIDKRFENVTVSYEDEEDGYVEEEQSSTIYTYAHFYNDEFFEFHVSLEGQEEKPVFNTPVKKPRVKLIGEDGNIFFIVARARKALREEGLNEQAEEMTNKVHEAENYHRALAIVCEYCEAY